MSQKFVLLSLLLLILALGCVSQTSSSPPVTSPSSAVTTLPPVITTSTPAPLLEKMVTVKRDTYNSWELTFPAGKRFEVEVITDGAPVDLLVLDLANYNRFSSAFSSNSGMPWEEYVIFVPGIVHDKVEFKAPRSGKYRVIVENADYLPGGAATTRDVSAILRVLNLD
ncbi:MAG: hypothetical protein LUO93_11675 [Methanomicrobiales archaeon]|nr:hypothetical protein [Methanomicrobiales archaeon]